jgi:hypothetical protein
LLDSLAVATPFLSAPLTQRAGFRAGAALWRALLNGCPPAVLDAALQSADQATETPAGGRSETSRRSVADRKAQGDGRFEDDLLGTDAAQPSSDDDDDHHDHGGGSHDDHDDDAAFELAAEYDSPAAALTARARLAHDLGGLLGASDGVELAERVLALEVHERRQRRPTSAGLLGKLRAVADACRGSLFDDAHFASDLAQFLDNAQRAAARSGALYTPTTTKAYIPLIR